MLFVGGLYLITNSDYLFHRPFETGSTISTALMIGVAQACQDISVPTQFGNFKPKYLPFISFIISLILFPLSGCDSLLSSIMGTTWAIIYLQKLQPHRGTRGDPKLTLDNLIPNPFCGCCTDLGDGMENDQEMPPNYPGNTFNPQGQAFGDNRPQRPEPRRDTFAGTAHHIN